RRAGTGAGISRTCQLGVSVGYLGVRRPGRHSWCLPGAVTANRPRFAARAGGLAAAIPADVIATDLAHPITPHAQIVQVVQVVQVVEDVKDLVRSSRVR